LPAAHASAGPAKYAAAMQGLISKAGAGARTLGTKSRRDRAGGNKSRRDGDGGGVGMGGGGDAGLTPLVSAPLVTLVQLPTTPTQMMVSSSRGGAGVIERVLLAGGYMRSDMEKVVDQLRPFASLERGLKTVIAEAFCAYEYPASSTLMWPDEVVSEAFLVLSGCCIVDGGPAAGTPVRVQPGAVLGLEHLLSKGASPARVATDPHFVTRVAALSYERFQRAITRWAIDQVVRLIPSLAASQERRLRAALHAGCRHERVEPGGALFVEGDSAGELVLLMQGQVLATKTAPEDVVLTGSQLVDGLTAALGRTPAVMLEPLGQAPGSGGGTTGGGSAEGGPRGATGGRRTTATHFGGASDPRRASMAVPRRSSHASGLPGAAEASADVVASVTANVTRRARRSSVGEALSAPGAMGMPLYTAMALQMKSTRQAIVAAFGGSGSRCLF
ncbi:hypothetical protein FOA52_009451, partial [Chlamydomonas sp. UWO 241]